VIVGSVLRFSEIKDPLNLVNAFIALQRAGSAVAGRVRLVMCGSGELHGAALRCLRQAGCEQKAWLPGNRDDIPAMLGLMNVFVLGSLREGISNTILEAMAAALPVVATDTGGNRELVLDGETGMLVPVADPASLAEAIRTYAEDPALVRRHGLAARQRAINCFSIGSMVANYTDLYRGELGRKGINPCAA
jgi:glycosyltransferase involved in cell wall biosynthesis